MKHYYLNFLEKFPVEYDYDHREIYRSSIYETKGYYFEL